jgi:hypothetical protein
MIDRWTVAHLILGGVLAAGGAPRGLVWGGAILWEILERPILADGKESRPNQVMDLVGTIGGYELAKRAK